MCNFSDTIMQLFQDAIVSTNVLAFRYLFNMCGNEEKDENIINHPSITANHIYLFFLIQCTYWKTFVTIYLTHRDLFFRLLNLISFSLLLMYQGEKEVGNCFMKFMIRTRNYQPTWKKHLNCRIKQCILEIISKVYLLL